MPSTAKWRLGRALTRGRERNLSYVLVATGRGDQPGVEQLVARFRRTGAERAAIDHRTLGVERASEDGQ